MSDNYPAGGTEPYPEFKPEEQPVAVAIPAEKEGGGDVIQGWYKDWCKRTNRSGGVLITTSIKELLVAYSQDNSFQKRVDDWMQVCFGAVISKDKQERNHRFIEEALELVQSCGATESECKQLVEYVYSRPVGEMNQEIGGVMVTLAALCLAQGADMTEAGETELKRIWTKVDKIREKQAAKPKHSPLPASPEPVEEKGFNEKSLRKAIVDKWGEYGAHIDVFDELVKRASQYQRQQGTEEWVSVEERLPVHEAKRTTMVVGYMEQDGAGLVQPLVFYEGEFYLALLWSEEGTDGERMTKFVTHWQPLPHKPIINQ